MAIQIGRWAFPTKHAAENHVRDILRRYSHMQRLMGEDDGFMRALLDTHPSRRIIIDCGIKYIYVENVPFAKTPQKRFAICRTDESRRDFSWRHAIYPRRAARKLAGVLRDLIAPQKSLFKERSFGGVCEACQAPLEADDVHVDHIAPLTFEALMAGWLASLHVTAEDIAIINFREYGRSSRLEDSLYEETWIEYHEINARLRCVCARCNLSTLRVKGEAA